MLTMDFFNYQNGQLHAEKLPVRQLAQEYGTPLYIYSHATLVRHYNAFTQALNGRKGLICYAVKANSNLAILQLLAAQGAGFDIVSGGELARVIAAGGNPRKVIFSGVAKTKDEIKFALEAGVLCFNVESPAELERINQVASSLNKVAPISLRINPNVDPQTHPYISTGLRENKFGIPLEQAFEIYQRAHKLPNLEIVGVDCHIGSQLTQISPYLDALTELKKLVRQLHQAGIKLKHIDIGGGLGVTYSSEAPPLPNELINAAFDSLQELFAEVGELELVLEPGRAIVANAGILVTEVQYTKENLDKRFCIVDAGMNDLIRPSLYGAFMNIINVDEKPIYEEHTYDVVGPVCETGCWLGKNRPLRVAEGSLLVVRGAGAYCSTMSSHYNTRPKVCELMVEGDKVEVIRERETYQDVWHREKLRNLG